MRTRRPASQETCRRARPFGGRARHGAVSGRRPRGAPSGYDLFPVAGLLEGRRGWDGTRRRTRGGSGRRCWRSPPSPRRPVAKWSAWRWRDRPAPSCAPASPNQDIPRAARRSPPRPPTRSAPRRVSCRGSRASAAAPVPSPARERTRLRLRRPVSLAADIAAAPGAPRRGAPAPCPRARPAARGHPCPAAGAPDAGLRGARPAHRRGAEDGLRPYLRPQRPRRRHWRPALLRGAGRPHPPGDDRAPGRHAARALRRMAAARLYPRRGGQGRLHRPLRHRRAEARREPRPRAVSPIRARTAARPSPSASSATPRRWRSRCARASSISPSAFPPRGSPRWRPTRN